MLAARRPSTARGSPRGEAIYLRQCVGDDVFGTCTGLVGPFTVHASGDIGRVMQVKAGYHQGCGRARWNRGACDVVAYTQATSVASSRVLLASVRISFSGRP
jgi:hypothetical protein